MENEFDFVNMFNFASIDTDKDKIIEEIEKRDIKYLFHFTKIENLGSIIENGIIARQKLNEQQINCSFNDELRLDKKLNSNCFSLEHPNYYLLNDFKNRNIGSSWVILKLNFVDLFETCDNKKYYTKHNAAWCPNYLESSHSSSCYAFSNLFTTEPIETSIKICRTDDMPDYFPTSEQAEILIDGIINCKYIINFYFEKKEDYDKFKCNPKYNLINSKFVYEEDCIYFKKRPANRAE